LRLGIAIIGFFVGIYRLEGFEDSVFKVAIFLTFCVFIFLINYCLIFFIFIFIFFFRVFSALIAFF